MKKNVLALLIASSIGLYGCGDESGLTGNPTIDPTIEKSLKAETKIVFDLVSKEKKPVMPSFLVMDTFDGTLKTDGDVLSTDPKKYSKDISDPAVALGKTDGWGTLEPIIIDFTGQQLKAETAINSFVLIESFNPTSTSDTTKPEPLTYGVDYVITVTPVSASESKLVVSLLQPLKPSANYMFAITNDLKDVKGNSVGMTGSYATLKTTATPPDDALKPAQTIVHATEATIAATTGVSAQNIIFSTWFTTASVGDSLYAAKAAIALSADAVVKTTQGTTPGNASLVWGSDINTTGMFSFSKTKEVSDYPGKTAAGVNKYTGTVKLPYFLETNTDATKFLTTPWGSATPSLAKVMNVLKRQDESSNILLAQLTSAEIGITQNELDTLIDEPSNKAAQLSVIQKLINKELYLDKDKKVRLDEERLITKYSPVPQLRSVADVPYNLYMPSTAACKDADANNIPVNIFTHGFTSNNDSADYYAAATLSQHCQALIAIDLPLHGDRWLGKGEDQILGYMNLGALPVARDNIRQSITDLMSLRASLGLLFGAKDEHGANTIEHFYGELSKLSLSNGTTPGVGYVGISLGGIVGIGYTATIDKPVIFDETTGEVDIKKETALFKATRAHFDVPGGAIAYFLFDSQKFGGTIQDALKASDGYPEFKAEKCTGLPDAACDSLFFNSFAFAAQSVLDTIDPANFINQIQTPVYLSMAENDKVIPNGPITGILKSAVAGTIPMIEHGKFGVVSGKIDKVTRNAALYREDYSFHGALATPPTKTANPIKYAPAIADMQKNSMTFLSQGMLPVENKDYLYQLN